MLDVYLLINHADWTISMNFDVEINNDMGWHISQLLSRNHANKTGGGH